tara:strand:- start:1759 stop:2475 length:717 start_codon:yes stop_codon:yes gene_type:complete
MSFSNLAGIVIIQENKNKKLKRLKGEIKRSGLIRLVDMIAFKVFYYFRYQKKDSKWCSEKLNQLRSSYNFDLKNIPTITVSNPNSNIAQTFITSKEPDIIIARCKVLLKYEIFSKAKTGTFIMHPGICPEYRNSHGCFWGIVNRDYDRIGMTLLKINRGIDSGPIYGYYYPKELNLNEESHIIIQYNSVFDNLELIQDKLLEIYDGKAVVIETRNRESKIWGQPWFTSYFKWKYNDKK